MKKSIYSIKMRKMTKKPQKRYTFTLYGVNIIKVDQKYSIVHVANEDEAIPLNTTKIGDLDIIRKTPNIVSFLDESKQLKRCTLSMIDFQTGNSVQQTQGLRYKCFWDREYIPDNVTPLGCPIKYISKKATKTYISEISKEKYSIRENVTVYKANELTDRKDGRLEVDGVDYYETDGVFCSFNCCMAFIQSPEAKHNPLYRYSEMLLLRMWSLFNDSSEPVQILPAPHWRTLREFGGHLSIEQFRESFNRIQFINHGIRFSSLGYLFEDKLKF